MSGQWIKPPNGRDRQLTWIIYDGDKLYGAYLSLQHAEQTAMARHKLWDADYVTCPPDGSRFQGPPRNNIM